MTITNGYATVSEFQTRTGLTNDQTTAKTTLIEREIERNSRIIDRVTSDVFYAVTLTTSKVRYGMGKNSDGLFMQENAQRIYVPGVITSISAITEDGVTLVEDEDFILGEDFIEAVGTFTTDKKVGVVVTGVAGYPAIPDDVNELCLAMSEVTTGLGTYTMIDSTGSKVDITRDSLPDWVDERLGLRKRYFDYG